MTSGGAAIAIKRRRMLESFRKAGATSVNSARTLQEIGVRDSRLLKIQIYRRVVVKVAEDTYYLDETRENEVAQIRKTVAFIFISASVIFLLLMLLMRK